jgi:hypothetical protein
MPLPEKDFFTLDEIIERWKYAGHDRQTLLDYAVRDLIVFSVYLRDLGAHQTVQETEHSIVTTQVMTAFSFRSPSYNAHPIRYLKGDDARRVLECRDGESAAVSVLFDSTNRDPASGKGYAQANYLKASDLLITRAERDRFEKANPLTVLQRIAKWWYWMRNASNQKPLAIVGSSVVASALAVWAVFTYLRPPGH